MTWTRRSVVALLALALLGTAAVPPASAAGATAVAAKKKCKKKAKGSAAAAKKRKCKKRSGTDGGSALPGQPTRPAPLAPSGAGSGSGGESGGGITYSVSAITVTPSTVLGGDDSAQGEVTINSPAPQGGQPVALQSSDSAAVVPSSVHVAADQTTATFPIDTETVATSVLVDLTASIGSSSDTAVLEVVADPSVESVELEYQCFPGMGAFAANRVTLDVPAPSDTVVDLQSSDDVAFDVPDSVTVPENAISALFGVNVNSATEIPSVTVTATAPNTPSAQDTAKVRDGLSAAPVLDDFSVSSSTIAPNGSVTGTVTLDCEALAGGETVTLASDNPNVTVPASVVVPQNELSAPFQITANGLAMGEATIDATLDSTTLQQTLTVQGLDT